MCIILHRRNASVRNATKAANRAAGVRARKTVKGTRRRIVHPSAGRAGVSVLIHASVAIFFAPVAVPAPNRATVLPARISSMMACARRNVRPCKSKYSNITHLYFCYKVRCCKRCFTHNRKLK